MRGAAQRQLAPAGLGGLAHPPDEAGARQNGRSSHGYIGLGAVPLLQLDTDPALPHSVAQHTLPARKLVAEGAGAARHLLVQRSDDLGVSAGQELVEVADTGVDLVVAGGGQAEGCMGHAGQGLDLLGHAYHEVVVLDGLAVAAPQLHQGLRRALVAVHTRHDQRAEVVTLAAFIHAEVRARVHAGGRGCRRGRRRGGLGTGGEQQHELQKVVRAFALHQQAPFLRIIGCYHVLGFEAEGGEGACYLVKAGAAAQFLTQRGRLRFVHCYAVLICHLPSKVYHFPSEVNPKITSFATFVAL